MTRNKTGSGHEAYIEAKVRIMALDLPAFRDPESPLPLRIGVFGDLSAIVGENTAHNFLMLWTCRWEYKASIARGGSRYDLHGNPDGEISAEAAASATPRASRGGRRSDRSGPPRSADQAARKIRRIRKSLEKVRGGTREKLEKHLASLEKRLADGKFPTREEVEARIALDIAASRASRSA